jgi:hypothetical protein
MNASVPLLGLTLERLRDSLAPSPCPPVVYYILSSALPAQTSQLVWVANDGATPMPYDLICHPDQLPALQTALAGMAELRLHGNPSWRRRIEHMVAWWYPASVASPS